MKEDQELDGLPGHSEAVSGAVGGKAAGFTRTPWVHPAGTPYVSPADDLGKLIGMAMNGDPAMREATASLWAAGPDLLEACQCALGHMTGNMDGDWDLAEDPAVLLRAAVRKALGGAA